MSGFRDSVMWEENTEEREACGDAKHRGRQGSIFRMIFLQPSGCLRQGSKHNRLKHFPVGQNQTGDFLLPSGGHQSDLDEPPYSETPTS